MNIKRITGWLIFTIGAAFVGYSVLAMQRIAKAKEAISSMNSLFDRNPMGNPVGMTLKEQVGQYDTQVMWIMIIGIVLTVGGALMGLLGRKK